MTNRTTIERNGKTIEQAYVVGKWGAAGTHSHLIKIEFTIQDEGQPWERMKILHSAPCCVPSAGVHKAHSLSMTAEVNEKTVTCEKCREFRLVSGD